MIKSNDTYNTIFITSISILICIIVFLSFFNLRLSLELKEISLEGTEQSADFYNQQIKLKFTRPLDKQIKESAITISPEIPFKLSSSSGNLIINFSDQSLISNTQYTIKLHEDVKDMYGHTLDGKDEIVFKTKVADFLYVDASKKDKDTLILTDIFQSKKINIFEAPLITSLAANKEFIALILSTDTGDEIVVISRKDNSHKKIALQGKRKLTNLEMLPLSNKILFMSQELDEAMTLSTPRLINLVDLNTNENKIINPGNTGEDVTAMSISHNGKYLSYVGFNTNCYILDIARPDSPALIKQGARPLGFSQNNNELFFLEQTESGTTPISLNAYELSAKKESVLYGFKDYMTFPIVSNNARSIIFSNLPSDLDTLIPLYTLQSVSLEAKTLSLIAQVNNSSLESPQLSADDTLLITEAFTKDQLETPTETRPLGIYDRKPRASTLMMYDMSSKKKVLEIPNAINAKWLY